MQKWTIEYFTTEAGHAPVKDFIDSLPTKTKAKTFHVFELLEEFGLEVGEPHVKKLEKSIWEARVSAADGTFRYLFTKKSGRIIILLHAINKKKQATPIYELKTARARLKEVE